VQQAHNPPKHRQKLIFFTRSVVVEWRVPPESRGLQVRAASNPQTDERCSGTRRPKRIPRRLFHSIYDSLVSSTPQIKGDHRPGADREDIDFPKAKNDSPKAKNDSPKAKNHRQGIAGGFGGLALS